MRRSTGSKIKAVEPLPDRVLLVSFDDGRKVLFEPTPYLTIDDYDVFSIAPGLFQCAKIDKSRSAVYWTDFVFVPADLIYESGQIVEDC